MDSSHIDTTPVEGLAQTNTTVDQKVDVLEPTNTTVDEKVDPTIPDGDAIETTTTPNSAPSQATTDTTQSCFWSFWKRLVYFYWDNEFLILIISAIALARAYPPLGAEYLASDITASWIAVIFIFSECYSVLPWSSPSHGLILLVCETFYFLQFCVVSVSRRTNSQMP